MSEFDVEDKRHERGIVLFFIISPLVMLLCDELYRRIINLLRGGNFCKLKKLSAAGFKAKTTNCR